MKTRSFDEQVEREYCWAMQRHLKEKKEKPHEDQEQIAFVAWVHDNHPGWLIWHTPNEATYKQARYQRAMGTRKGMPDILILPIRAAIEFKSLGGKITKEQREILVYLNQIGWHTKIAYSNEEAQKFVEALPG